MILINDSIIAVNGTKYVKKKDTTSKNELHPDSTIFGRRNDTTFLNIEKCTKINIMNVEYHYIASALRRNTDKAIYSVTKDSVVRIMKNYQNECRKSFVQDICRQGPLLRNSKKKFYLSHTKECFSERAKELNIDVSDLDKDFEDAMETSFTGFWVKIFGIMKKKNIERLNNITDEYLNRIEQKEAEIRENRFHKPFTDEQAEEALNKVNHDYYISDIDDYYYDILCKDTILRKGVSFNGIIDHPSMQMDGTCVMHASINALVQNEKGAHLVNRLLRYDIEENTLKTCLPEAVLLGVDDKYDHVIVTDKNLAKEISFGDGDLAALIANDIDYSKNNDKIMSGLNRGFEVLSGERTQVYFQDESIPKGVGIVYNYNGANTLYKNLKTMLDDGNGAAICGVRKIVFNYDNLGNYITDLESETDTGEEVFDSDEHAYSIVKMTDDYVYLQESNKPVLYIKLPKKVFIDRLSSVATWRYD